MEASTFPSLTQATTTHVCRHGLPMTRPKEESGKKREWPGHVLLHAAMAMLPTRYSQSHPSPHPAALSLTCTISLSSPTKLESLPSPLPLEQPHEDTPSLFPLLSTHALLTVFDGFLQPSTSPRQPPVPSLSQSLATDPQWPPCTPAWTRPRGQPHLPVSVLLDELEVFGRGSRASETSATPSSPIPLHATIVDMPCLSVERLAGATVASASSPLTSLPTRALVQTATPSCQPVSHRPSPPIPRLRHLASHSPDWVYRAPRGTV
jgi:hypothetical protein